jgi:hypothetical protein
MPGVTGWVRNLRARWSESRARKREAQSAHARHGSDPSPAIHRRHGEIGRDPHDYGGGA